MTRRRAKAKRSIDQLELTAVGTLEEKPRRRVADTSRAAATKATHRTAALRDLILRWITESASRPSLRGATADEVAEWSASNQSDVMDVRRLMEIRRRTSDLHKKLKKIQDTGLRRQNAAGNPMIVWAPIPNAEARNDWQR